MSDFQKIGAIGLPAARRAHKRYAHRRAKHDGARNAYAYAKDAG